MICAVRNQHAMWPADSRAVHSDDSKRHAICLNGGASVATATESGFKPATYTAIAPARRGVPLL